MEYDGKIYGKVGGKFIELEGSVIEDNARLRAENARLLEALKDCLPIIKHFIKNHEFITIEKAESAIAEAEK